MVQAKFISIKISLIHIFLALFCEILIQKFFQEQEALRALWSASFPGQELESLVSDQWKEMGWQGRDPSTDFRLYFPCQVITLFYGFVLFLLLTCSFLWDKFCEQRSWFHFIGEPSFLCEDILSKILNYMTNAFAHLLPKIDLFCLCSYVPLLVADYFSAPIE